jgi:endoglucanase
MERGINLGGAFDRRDGQPGWQVRPEVLDAIAAAGFTGIRLPVRWANARLAEVAEVVEAVVTRGVSVVLTNHHDDEAMAEGYGAAGRLAELWRGLATRFLGFRGELAFELLNEPLMSAADWNRLLPAVLASVREVDPDRLVVVGGADASSVAGLRALELPADDRLVATVHYYEPFRFTHQAAGWLPGADAWRGATWGTAADRAAVTADLSEAVAWARDHGVHLYVGEFGVLAAADRASRLRWTAWVRRELERLGIPWAYWDLATEFGAYDLERGAWDAELLDGLLGRPGGPTKRAANRAARYDSSA